MEPLTTPALICQPSVLVKPLTEKDRFVVFGSDGLWENVSNEETVELVSKFPRLGIARRLVKLAMVRAAKKRKLTYGDLKTLGPGELRSPCCFSADSPLLPPSLVHTPAMAGPVDGAPADDDADDIETKLNFLRPSSAPPTAPTNVPTPPVLEAAASNQPSVPPEEQYAIALEREALAAKDAAESLPVFNMIDNTVRAIAEHLGRSGPWHQRFKDLQEVFTETFLELQGIHTVRWLSRGDAIARFVAVLPAVITMLKEWNDKLYKVVTSFRFHFLLFFLADVLDQMNVLSRTFQRREIRRTTGHLEARYVDCEDEFGGGLSPRLSPWLEKHGPEDKREVCIEGSDSDGQACTFTFILHEDKLDDYPGPGHQDACIDICTEFAELIVANLLDRLGDLDKLSGVGLFTPDNWPHGRHERQAKCQEHLEALITLFRAEECEEIIPGVDKKKAVKEVRLLIPVLSRAPKVEIWRNYKKRKPLNTCNISRQEADRRRRGKEEAEAGDQANPVDLDEEEDAAGAADGGDDEDAMWY
ncbi:unnamed protein product [Closterium sp. Naga37s-1]|nr:unnamed protein product [Closterium sp. Naga37s-1]